MSAADDISAVREALDPVTNGDWSVAEWDWALAALDRLAALLAATEADRDEAVRDWNQYVHEIADETSRAEAAEKERDEARRAYMEQRGMREESDMRLVESLAREAALRDAAEMLWVVVANVSEGDWTKQTEEWQVAAARWRDNYHAALAASSPEGER